MHGAFNDLMVLLRRGDQQRMRLQAAAHEVERMGHGRPPVHGEILRRHLKQHAIFFKPGLASQVESVPQVIGVDWPRTAKVVNPPRLLASNKRSADTHDDLAQLYAGASFDFRHRLPDVFGGHILVSDLAPHPSTRWHGRVADIADAAILQSANQDPRVSSSQVESSSELRFVCHVIE